LRVDVLGFGGGSGWPDKERSLMFRLGMMSGLGLVMDLVEDTERRSPGFWVGFGYVVGIGWWTGIGKFGHPRVRSDD
jgi:hypothetical protein